MPSGFNGLTCHITESANIKGQGHGGPEIIDKNCAKTEERIDKSEPLVSERAACQHFRKRDGKFERSRSLQ